MLRNLPPPPTGLHVYSIDREPGLQISKPWIVRGNEFLYPAPRVKEGGRIVSCDLENGSLNLTGNNEDANFTSTVREVLQIAYNLPTNHVLEDYLGPFMNKVNGIEANLILEALAEEEVTQQVLSFFRWMRIESIPILELQLPNLLFNGFTKLLCNCGRIDLPGECTNTPHASRLQIRPRTFWPCDRSRQRKISSAVELNSLHYRSLSRIL